MGGRIIRLQIALVVALALILGRLAQLQLVQGGTFRRLAEQNRLRIVPEAGPRGVIYDRKGRILAATQTVFRVALVPQDIRDLPTALAHVSLIVQRPVPALTKAYKKERSLAFLPATIVSRVPKDIALRLEEERWRLPGVLVQAETARAYPQGPLAAHVLGYVGLPSPEEYERLKRDGVRFDDLIGRTGLERRLDDILRGRAGGELVEVDHRARQVRTIGERPSEAGHDATLTLDAGLQSLVEASLGAQPGAVVVVDPDTGDILAMVSRPGYNPEAFALLDNELVTGYLTDAAAPLMNRATTGAYAPGSTAKLVTAITALEQKVITPSTTITCPGYMKIGDRTIHCWNRDGHGALDLRGALLRSCNVYFMQIGRWLGPARLRAGFAQAGFGRKTGWPLEEQPGHIPQRRLTEGEVAMMAIGQTELLVTPLQQALFAASLANGGWLHQPRIVREDGRHPPIGHRIGFSRAALDGVRPGMRAVVEDPDGTGHRAATGAITIAAKTGTAQSHIKDHPHGWILGYCPVDHPKAAFAIVVEHGGSGGDLPAEIARALCEYIAAPETL